MLTNTHPRSPRTANCHRNRRPGAPRTNRNGCGPRVTFYTAASHHDDGNPHATVMAQYADRQTSLGHQIRAVFFDITGT
ncbi:MAG: hypothetical protein ACRDT1_16910, partial [Micromonosporaceae bacterium]